MQETTMRHGLPADPKPGEHLLFIGAASCMRHHADELVQLQREGRLSFLCLDEIDLVTGSYLEQIEQALSELEQQKKTSSFRLCVSCPCEVLSTDFNLLAQSIYSRLGLDVTVESAGHLNDERGEGRGSRGSHRGGHPHRDRRGLR